jgi:hypothetical protein
MRIVDCRPVTATQLPSDHRLVLLILGERLFARPQARYTPPVIEWEYVNTRTEEGRRSADAFQAALPSPRLPPPPPADPAAPGADLDARYGGMARAMVTGFQQAFSRPRQAGPPWLSPDTRQALGALRVVRRHQRACLERCLAAPTGPQQPGRALPLSPEAQARHALDCMLQQARQDLERAQRHYATLRRRDKRAAVAADLAALQEASTRQTSRRCSASSAGKRAGRGLRRWSPS